MSDNKCFRHFKALMRKNFILWYRMPACSAFELLAPIIMMIALTIIRMQIPVLSTDQAGMFKKKWVVYLGAQPNGIGTWYQNNDEDDWANIRMRPFACYTSYFDTKKDHQESCDQYNIGNDWRGPTFYAPSQCLKTYSWNKPKVSSPLIGIIGEESDLTDSYGLFYIAIRKQQFDTAAALGVPFYKPYHFSDINEFNDYITSPDYATKANKGVCMAIQLEQPSANDYRLSIHFNDKRIGLSKYSYAQGIPDQTQAVWKPQIAAPNLLSYTRYQHNGFSFVQNLFANQILQHQKNDVNAFIAFMLQPMQTETSVDDLFGNALGILLPLFLLLAYIPPVYNMTFKIVREKESRAKETMRIMGMTDLPYWLSWLAFYTIVNTVVTTVSWAILLIKVVNYSNPMYLWIFFWVYGQAVFGQIIFLQSMFTGSKYAGIVSTIVYFCGVLINKLVLGDDVSRANKLLASLLPQVALMQGSVVFANYEGTGVGLDSSTASIIYGNYSFDSSLWMMALDFFIYFFLGLYMDKVIPSDFGQRLSPFFLCTPSYYSCCRSDRRRGDQVDDDGVTQPLTGDQDGDEFESSQMPGDNYESPPVFCKRLEASGDYLKIDNLQKTFDGGFRAVAGVSMKMYDSQIFALLGHNGAGKSTLISMLTGLIKKSQGNAKAYNVDMFEEMDELREFMGVCPQHDVLFDHLTPREHLDIFYDFKGGDPARKRDEINSLITDVGLTIDQYKKAGTLSGGNKRKLSVSIALCGGSRVVLLDEPTSGMDLGARRNLWDMLKSYKKDRIIILTTHYMDEADVLGDRIGIMCKGTLQCLGSSLFLKNRFGVGYKITFVKQRRKTHPGLEQFLQTYFQGITKANELTDEVSFVIPKAQARNFGSFFEELDQRLDQYDIKSYGVSMSNLEDVFLKINQEYAPDLFGDLKKFDDSRNSSQSEDEKKKVQAIGNSTERSTKKLDDSTGSASSDEYEQDPDDAENLIRGSSCTRSCTASAAKRYIIYKRDWCGLLCQVIIPLILVLFGLWLTSGPSKLQQSPPKHMSTGWFPSKQRILMSEMPYNTTDLEGNEMDGQVSGKELVAAMPNSTSFFDVTYVGNLTYNDFYDEFFESRNEGEVFPYRFGSYNIFEANKITNQFKIVNYLNITSQDVTALYPQYMLQAILRTATDDPDLNFDVTSVPFPIYQKFKDIEEAASAYDFVFMTAIALALIPCVMVQFILNEREMQLKQQQLISGMSLAGYWASNVIFDIVMAYVPILLIIMLTFVFSVHFEGIWVLFLLYPPAIVPFTYVTSFLFTSDINAQITTLFIHFVAGGLLTIVVFVLQYIPKTMPAGDVLRWVFTIFPTFCVTHGILFSASGSLLIASRTDMTTSDGVIIPRKLPKDIWAWENLKGDAMILILHFVVGLIILTLIEMEVISLLDWCPGIGCRGSGSARNEVELVKDDDVFAEEQRVAMQGTGVTSEVNGIAVSDVDAIRDPNAVDCIRVNNFSKQYDSMCGAPIKAVKRASFGLDYGECFALLGVNGAGKSTTFKSLTRDIQPTTGEITIQGFDIQKQFEDARKLIGYCPQYDAIFPKLTVEETIKFYALIKGIRTHKIPRVLEKAIKDLNLKDHRHKLAGTLSGGNKRKLSVAMALIGNPPIILLDEPSAGMDPEARRFMWQVVEKISQRDKKSAVILTTHSMEEAEALSTKLGIMVRGGIFRCMGSSQHIKSKFGVGYEVEIKVKKSQYSDLEEMARQLGFKNTDLQQRVNLRGAVEQCAGAQFDDLILDQIRPDGIGHDLAREGEIDNENSVRLSTLLDFLWSQTFGFRILHYLTRHFDRVEVLEQCGEFFKLRVPKEDKTIGWLFGQFEQSKDRLGIEEYSVTQTTLEQIFQTFANQSIASDKAAFTFRAHGERIMLMNPDHKMTEVQEHNSQRGLSFNEVQEGMPVDQAPSQLLPADGDAQERSLDK